MLIKKRKRNKIEIIEFNKEIWMNIWDNEIEIKEW